MAFEMFKNMLSPESDDEATQMLSTLPVSANVQLYSPKKFEDTGDIAQSFKANNICIINVAGINKKESQRIIDFMTGVVFALSGSIRKIEHNIILCSPHSVGIGTVETKGNDSE